MGKHRLVLTGCQLEDEAYYTCIVGERKTSASLHVKELPNQFVTPLEDITILEGETAKFSCESSKAGKPTWKRNGRDLRESDRVKLDSTMSHHTLTIKNGMVED